MFHLCMDIYIPSSLGYKAAYHLHHEETPEAYSLGAGLPNLPSSAWSFEVELM